LEASHPAALALGAGATSDDVAAILDAHGGVLPNLRSAEPDITEGVDRIVGLLAAGGRLVYVGAGTSGWLAALDAAEVVVTFGMAGRVASVVGGGHTLDPVAMALGDDAIDSLAGDDTVAQCRPGDVVLAVSASGRTPFTVTAVNQMRARGAVVVALVNEAGSPLAALADVVICVPIDGEVVAGSTRLTAGLAQKVVLNTVSTAAMVRLGRAYNGQMVCVVPLNEKLRQRLALAVGLATG
jgi:N-acetylmuramic acid 6-phosphate etherase